MFLSAVVRVGGSCFPVRIRNLSPLGALVDGNDLPNRGDIVRLHRGPHSVAATVRWRNDQACGLRFSSPVPVQEWIAYARAHRGQQQVDEIVAGVRGGVLAGEPAEAAAAGAAIDCVQAAEQLVLISQQLDEVALAFAAIPAVIEEGSAALQGVDLARQKLVDLAARMRPGAR